MPVRKIPKNYRNVTGVAAHRKADGPAMFESTLERDFIALLEFDKGGRIPVKHTHASNQFMYCLSGDYEYTDVGLRLKPGSYYMNPKDHPHGPTIAHEKSVLIEIYDGPHYYEKPVFHTDETIGDFLAKKE